MVVIIDTCSLHRLVEYYLPLDREGFLVPLLDRLFTSREMMMTDFVYTECQRMAKGIILEKLPFLKSDKFKKTLIKTDVLIPNQKLMRIVLEHFIIKPKYNGLKAPEQEIQRQTYFQSGDFSLIYCAYQKKKGLMNNLFPDELKVLTDESGNENGSSCFKKIPTCCKFLEVDTLNIREYLDFITDGKIELMIKEG